MYINKTADLVNQWAAFEVDHPEAGIGEFCRYFLACEREKEAKKKLFDGAIPPRPDIVLSKLIDRIAKLHMVYINMAKEGIPVSHFEEFALLNAIANLPTPKKTEVIYHTINELSTGLNLLTNLRKRGYITEHEDPDDKRSRRLNLTTKGEKVLRDCYRRFSKVPELLFVDMTSQDIELCVQLLKNVDLKFSGLWQFHKSKSFDHVYEMLTGNKPDDKKNG